MSRSTVLVVVALLVGGCSHKDAERLSRMARAVVARGENAGGESNLAGLRISARLCWDKALEGARIEVHAHDGEVELSGTVRDAAQRSHAVEVAKGTVGAESVVDQMTTSEP
jgi:hypothetical protein